MSAEKEVIEKVVARIRLLADRGFYGRLTLSFRGGYVYQALEERSMKFDTKNGEGDKQ
jgi:hypothetical protein